MNLREIRRLNGLVQEKLAGGRKDLAKLLGYYDTNQLNGVFSGANSFGDRLTARFEKHLGLPEFWMSTPHPALWAELDEKYRNGRDANDFVYETFAGFDRKQLEAAITIAAHMLSTDDDK